MPAHPSGKSELPAPDAPCLSQECFCQWAHPKTSTQACLGVQKLLQQHKLLARLPSWGLLPPWSPQCICLLVFGELGQSQGTAEVLAALCCCDRAAVESNGLLFLFLLQGTLWGTCSSLVPLLSDLPIFLLRCILLINPATLNEAPCSTGSDQRNSLSVVAAPCHSHGSWRSLSQGSVQVSAAPDALPGVPQGGTSPPLLPHRLLEICRQKGIPFGLEGKQSNGGNTRGLSKVSCEQMEAPAPAGPEDHLKVQPESHEKQTELRSSSGESSGAPEDSNTGGEGTGGTAVSSTTAKPAANPKTNPFFFGKGASPSRAAVSHLGRVSTLLQRL